MKLFFDTETTGLVNWKLPFDQQESRMVQLGMVVTDDNLNTIHEVGLIIKPSGFVIPDHVAAIHGITQEMAMKYGCHHLDVLSLFKHALSVCDTLIGHNLKFDKAIIATELMYNCGFRWKEKKEYCTMLESTSICQLKGPRGFKWPKLSEAYMFFFNEELVDAHDALTDVRATVRIYKELMRRNTPNPYYSALEKGEVNYLKFISHDGSVVDIK